MRKVSCTTVSPFLHLPLVCAILISYSIVMGRVFHCRFLLMISLGVIKATKIK